jgi:pimeloyl-ACP methyl ester carboxylesterase
MLRETISRKNVPVKGVPDVAVPQTHGVYCGAQKAIIPNSAHLPNMEEPDRFHLLVRGFPPSTPAQLPPWCERFDRI